MRPSSSGSATIGVGVIGLGFMGRTHVAAYEQARQAGYGCRLAAICDTDVDRLTPEKSPAGNIAAFQKGGAQLYDPSEVRTYSRVDELLADPAIQLVSICTHTETHVDLTLRALAAGKHVLVEKPLATRSADAARVADAAERAGTLCMPALCMRFWPGWSWLKQRIDDGSYGAVRSAVFERLASPPQWAPDFYADHARTGGALVDLHIHDADFVRWCFGDPATVSSTGTIDHVTTLYRYPGGPAHVVAEGGWDHSHGFPFKMRYVVAFERATAEFDSGREPPLMLATGGELNPVPLESITGWDLEIRHMLRAIHDGRRELIASADDAVGVARLLERELESLRVGSAVRVG
ncbi:MAG: oxidoreductase [Planctomycetota bacterium]